MAVKVTNVTGPGVKPDARYNSVLVSKFINCLMYDGKKSIAEGIFYSTLEELRKKVKDQDPVKTFETAVNNVKPTTEVRSRRVGGANYQVPVPVQENRKLSLAIRWILDAARNKGGKPMYIRLSSELFDAYNREGIAMKKREETHKMAEANKAFAHFSNF